MEYLIDDLVLLAEAKPNGWLKNGFSEEHTVVTSTLDYDYDENEQRVGNMLMDKTTPKGILFQHIVSSIIWFLETKPSKTLIVFMDQSLEHYMIPDQHLNTVINAIMEYDLSLFWINHDPNGLLLGKNEQRISFQLGQLMGTYEDSILFRFGLSDVLCNHENGKKLFIPNHTITFDTKQSILYYSDSRKMIKNDYFTSRLKEVWSNENLKQAWKHVEYRVDIYERANVEQIDVERVTNVYTTIPLCFNNAKKYFRIL